MQTSGFTTAQVLNEATLCDADTHAAFIGHAICDPLVVAMREMAPKLWNANMKGAKDALIVLDGQKVFVWKVRLNGDTYERKTGKTQVLRGSVAVLRKNYGDRVTVGATDAQVTKLLSTKKADLGTIKFYGLEHLLPQKAKKAPKVIASKPTKAPKVIVSTKKTPKKQGK